jgi:hypothetical protein
MGITMEKTKHLSYLTLYFAAHKQRRLKPLHWAHLKDCRKCMLRFATMFQVRADLQDLSSKYSAA